MRGELEFADFVAKGTQLLQERDEVTWELGDLALEFEITVGRPVEGQDVPTLGDLADAWNVSPQRVSEWRNVSAFYPTDARTFDLPWEHYNLARRAADGALDNAQELLHQAVDMAYSARQFRNWLNDVVWRGVLDWHELPPSVRPLVPQTGRVLATFKRYLGDDHAS